MFSSEILSISTSRIYTRVLLEDSRKKIIQEFFSSKIPLRVLSGVALRIAAWAPGMPLGFCPQIPGKNSPGVLSVVLLGSPKDCLEITV